MLLHQLIEKSAERFPSQTALRFNSESIDYQTLLNSVVVYAQLFLGHDLKAGDRVGIYLEKCPESVFAIFGTSLAGGIFVPINPALKAEQVFHILENCDVKILFTSSERLNRLTELHLRCPSIQVMTPEGRQTLSEEVIPHHKRIESDPVGIFYTSGSTGKPKGVVVSHRNLIAGAESVASYLANRPSDRLLAALPISFDAGFSQLTTAFHVGACVVLMNYLFPKDVLKMINEEEITGLTAVPPLYFQLAQLSWPSQCSLRYFASTGGRMPRETLSQLRQKIPQAQPFLMYGLTEAFRSSFLPPAEVDRRPDSIGKAIPNVELLVLRKDGTPCMDNEPGELVHRGPLVTLGYWNDQEKTSERFRPLSLSCNGVVLPEIVVFSGDTVRRDEQGFLYFIGREDEMIKTSGFRVSPTEVEEIIYSSQLVDECIVYGLCHTELGQAIHAIVKPHTSTNTSQAILAYCRQKLPSYMVPVSITLVKNALPRNANGKLDRKLAVTQFNELNISKQS